MLIQSNARRISRAIPIKHTLTSWLTRTRRVLNPEEIIRARRELRVLNRGEMIISSTETIGQIVRPIREFLRIWRIPSSGMLIKLAMSANLDTLVNLAIPIRAADREWTAGILVNPAIQTKVIPVTTTISKRIG